MKILFLLFILISCKKYDYPQGTCITANKDDKYGHLIVQSHWGKFVYQYNKFIDYEIDGPTKINELYGWASKYEGFYKEHEKYPCPEFVNIDNFLKYEKTEVIDAVLKAIDYSKFDNEK